MNRESESLRRAIDKGIVPGLRLDPFFADWSPPGIDPKIVKLANLIRRSPPLKSFPPETQWIDPARDTQAQLYQDKWFEHSPPFQDGFAYELARFQSGIDQVAIVKYIATFVDILDGPGGVPLVPDPFDPFWIQNSGLHAHFILRLEQGDQNYFNRAPWTGPINHIPGYGYGQLPRWNDYRFIWGRTANDVWFLVPRRHALRLYLAADSRSVLINRIMGRLQGFSQPTSNLAAMWNVKHGW